MVGGRAKEFIRTFIDYLQTFSTTIPALTLEKADKAPGTNVPAIVMCCVETLERKGFLRTEGLYRSSPSQLEVRKVIKHVSQTKLFLLAIFSPITELMLPFRRARDNTTTSSPWMIP